MFQVEYANKAVENSGTAIGLRGKDGVVFAVEKLVTSKLYEPGTNPRIFNIDKHVGMVSIIIGLKLVIYLKGANNMFKSNHFKLKTNSGVKLVKTNF